MKDIDLGGWRSLVVLSENDLLLRTVAGHGIGMNGDEARHLCAALQENGYGRVCVWVMDNYGIWTGSCGEELPMDERADRPETMRWNFCPHCGGKIEVRE